MAERILFLDIDGPMIPSGMTLVDEMASYNCIPPPICVAVVTTLVDRAGLKIVTNSIHNRTIGDLSLRDRLIDAGVRADAFHDDWRTAYPDVDRRLAVDHWLVNHRSGHEIPDWIAFDDAPFTDDERLILVDGHAGLTPAHLNRALAQYGLDPMLFLI